MVNLKRQKSSKARRMVDFSLYLAHGYKTAPCFFERLFNALFLKFVGDAGWSREGKAFLLEIIDLFDKRTKEVDMR